MAIWKRLFIICFIVSLSCQLVACGMGGAKSDPYKDMSAEDIYSKGKEYTTKKRYALAVKTFEALETKYPYGEYTDKGHLALIHAYYEQGDGPSVLAAADRFIRLNPRHPDVDYAYYMKGVMNYDQNFSTVYRYFRMDRSKRDSTYARQAFDDFKQLLDKFPKSQYAADARQRMAHLRNQLADHELYIAGQYFNKGAYLAAANRAGYIVNQFEKTEAVPGALVTMVKSYRALGMDVLAGDALKILESNFPDAPELAEIS